MADWTGQSGGCQCGAIRYTLTSKPTVVYCCHCTECQKQSSSAFGISVRVEASALDVTGTPAHFDRPSPAGDVHCEFCADCGSRLFHRRATYSEMLNIKGGTFDNTGWLNPAGHIWVASKQPWVTLPGDAITYSRQPETYDRLAAAWRPAQK